MGATAAENTNFPAVIPVQLLQCFQTWNKIADQEFGLHLLHACSRSEGGKAGDGQYK